MAIIAPSLLAANFANLEKDIKALEENQIKMLHLDVMDGVFVNNISFGIPVIESLNKITDMYFDCHLMISDPIKYLDAFVDAGANLITFHYEATNHVKKVINEIKKRNVECGLAFNPQTSINKIKPYLKDIDLILVMSVTPGFGGQEFQEVALEKIAALKEYISENNLKCKIQVDGGVNPSNISNCKKNGADILVAGSAVFANNEIKNNIEKLNKLIIE